jgi:hypothetical protein
MKKLILQSASEFGHFYNDHLVASQAAHAEILEQESAMMATFKVFGLQG